MSDADPIATLLADLSGPVAPRRAFAEVLRSRLLAELEAPVPARELPRRPAGLATAPKRRNRLRAGFVAVALLLLLATAATATYVVIAGDGGHVAKVSERKGVASLSGIGADGRVRAIWQCPHQAFCGDVVSVAWAPDGRRIAISVTEIGGHSVYPGLHVIDAATGKDRKLFGLSRDIFIRRPKAAAERAERRFVQMTRRFGCFSPDEIAWSPDGSKIAYVCAVVRNRYQSSDIHIIDADGSHPRLLHTGTAGAAWPSWSPTGTTIAFSTGNRPHEDLRIDTAQPHRIPRSTIYTIGVDGRHRRRVVTDAVAPAWSPDGSTIAYRSGCHGQVRLVSPEGRDLTPEAAPARCYGIGPAGYPAWSPDGRRLAIGDGKRVVVVDPDGSNPRRSERSSAEYGFSALRPTWQPLPGS